MTKYKRAKNLVNVGEISKAMGSILSNGVAKVDDEVLNQLRSKHPQRPSAVHLPSMELIKAERVSWQNIDADTDIVDSFSENFPEEPENKDESTDDPKFFP